MNIHLLPDRYAKKDFIVFLLFFVSLNPITRWGSSDFILILISLFGAAYILYIKQERLDNVILYVILFWCVINFFSYNMLGSSGFSLQTFIGSILKLFIGYAFLKIAKENFLVWFEQIVFFLSVISVFFFVVQVIQPSFFTLIPFNFAEENRLAAGHWNGIIFNFTTYHPFRNSGFAGEPGTFGYYTGMAMIFNLILNKGKFTPRFILFALIGLTTFSTNFYFSLLLFGLYFIYKSSVLVKVISISIFIPAVVFFYQLPFMGEKLDMFISNTQEFNEAQIVQSERINRMAIFVSDMGAAFEYPLGHGINDTALPTNIYGQILDGTNGISRIALRFGIFGLLYFIVIYFKLFEKLSLKMKGNFFFTFIVLLYIAANSMERDYIAMGIFWLYFIVSYEDIAKLVDSYNQEQPLSALKESMNPDGIKPLPLILVRRSKNYKPFFK